MKLLLSLLGLLACNAHLSPKASEDEHMFHFFKFIKEHNKQYTEEDFHKRFALFREAYDYVEWKNSHTKDYKLAINEFADMTKEERNHRRGTTVPSWLLRQNDMIQGKFNASGSIGDLPSSVDWVAKGACNAPKNQGQCGSCWAFSTIGGVESLNKIKTGSLVSLSEQQLVDCAGAYGGNGCAGGQVPSGSDYSKDNAVCTEADYPYEGSQSTCRAGACKGIVQLKGFNYVESSNEQAMMAAVAENPIIVAIDASGRDFNYYNGGVLTAYCGTGLDHGVLVVGYGTSDEGVDYWKVRNSWGASWGEQGYIRMKRGVSGVGYCGILSIPIQPTM